MLGEPPFLVNASSLSTMLANVHVVIGGGDGDSGELGGGELGGGELGGEIIGPIVFNTSCMSALSWALSASIVVILASCVASCAFSEATS